MKTPIFKFKVKVKLFTGKAAWYFAMLPKDGSKSIDELFSDQKRGWGSLPVKVSLGKTTWETSIFPDNKKKMYMLPLKKEVRLKEGIDKGDVIFLEISIRL